MEVLFFLDEVGKAPPIDPAYREPAAVAGAREQQTVIVVVAAPCVVVGSHGGGVGVFSRAEVALVTFGGENRDSIESREDEKKGMDHVLFILR